MARAVVVLAILLGLLIRIAAAQGDLWLDELWSLDLVSRLGWAGEVFWALPHDNNHPLNSLWLALLGPGHAPGLYRLPAIVFGTTTIAAATRLCWRITPTAGVAAAILTACAYPLVLYGSEARGYAGLILAMVLSIAWWRRLMGDLAAGIPIATLARPSWMLAATTLFGTASHFTMLGGVAVLGVATVLRRWPVGGLLGAVDEAVMLFRPVLLVLLPFCLLVAGGALAHGGFVVGGMTPFAPPLFLAGYGGLLAEFLGLRTVAPMWIALSLTAALLAVGFAAQLIDRSMLPLAIASLGLLPAALFLARIGNTDFPRYFLVAGLILPLLLAEMAGRLWQRGIPGRIAASLLIGLPCLGQVPDLVTLLRVHRGAPVSALALVDAGTTIRLRGDAPFAASFVADWYGSTGQHRYIPPTRPPPCDTIPDWLILDGGFADAVPGSIHDGAPICPSFYALVRSFPTAPWSGRAWSVYRRAP